MSLIFTCDRCDFSLEAWDDGNPYVIKGNGKREYFYHPSPIPEPPKHGTLEYFETDGENVQYQYGNAPEHICLKCAKQFKCDPEHDPMICPTCKHSEIVDLFEMGGRPCPKCPGTLSDIKHGAIS